MFRLITLAFVLLVTVCTSLSAQNGGSELNGPLAGHWVIGTRVMVPHDEATVAVVIYGDGLSWWANVPRRALPPQQWHTIDLKPYGVPANAVSARLQGLLRSSGSPDDIICTVTATVRRTGSGVDWHRWQLQGSGSVIGGSYAASVAREVALSNGQFDLHWIPNGVGALCQYSAIWLEIESVLLP